MSKTKITKETYLKWYELMVRMRKFEERAGMLYGQQKIRGFCHLYIGQEAVGAGIASATRQEDPVITAYRDHALAIGKGMSARECMAELMGKVTGCSKGKGGSKGAGDLGGKGGAQRAAPSFAGAKHEDHELPGYGAVVEVVEIQTR